MKIVFYILLLFLLPLVVSAGTAADSLIEKLGAATTDTARINLLNKICVELSEENVSEAFKYGEQAQLLSEKTGFGKGLGTALYNLGNICKEKAEYQKALDYFLKSLKVREQINDPVDISSSCVNIGLVYKDMNAFEKSQEYLNRADKLSEEAHDLNGLSNAKNGLGSLFWKSKNYEQALIQYMKSLEIRERLGIKKDMAATMNNLGMVYKDYSNFKLAKEYYNKSLEISRSISDKKTVAYTLNLIGGLYWDMKEYGDAIEIYLESLKIREELGVKKDIASTYHNIGSVFKNINLNEKALDYYKQALSLRKELGDESLLAYTLNDMGSVYRNLKQYEDAVKYYEEALRIRRNLADKIGIAASYKNIGIVYKEKKQYDVAILTYEKALDLFDEMKDKKNYANVLNYLGNVYLEKNEYNTARDYYTRALEVSRTASYKEGIAYSNLNIADMLQKSDKKQEVVVYLEEALAAATDINQKEALLKIYDSFEKLYAGLQDYKKAWEYKNLYISIRDSLQEEETIRKIAEVQVKYLVYKQEKEMHDKELELIKNQVLLSKEKYIRYILLGGFFIILLILFLLYKQYKIKKRSNEQLAFQKGEIEKQAHLLEFANTQLQEKNTQITDSIHYAKLIQEAILPSEKQIRAVFPEFFIYFRPRDIVSGDFYWYHREEDKEFFAVVDCTGHGVPGGFMSMIGYTLLNDIVKEKKVFDPSKVFEKLNAAVYHTLNQNDSKQDDGMDISFCCIDKKANKMLLGVANQNAYIVQNGNVRCIPGDIYSIGGIFSTRVKVSYTTHVIDITPGTVLYMLSDGYPDQIGEEENEKFSTSQFERIITEIHSQPMADQSEFLNKKFLSWKGGKRQIDDVLVTGIRF